MLLDLHTHTEFSPDSDEKLEKMCLRALELGLSAYAVTDHCEANRFFSRESYNRPANGYEYDIFDYEKVFEASLRAVTDSKSRFPELNLLCGIEWGQALYDEKATAAMCADRRLDFVIGSLHELNDMPDFAFLNYREIDIQPLLTRYFSEIYKLCVNPVFDTLGHLTYTLRYIEGKYGIPVDMKPFDDIIAESLRALARNGKGLEINTSGLRQSYGKTFPTPRYVKMFREFGGEIITIGSDAHCSKDIAKSCAEGLQIAKSSGFEYTAYFRNRKPVFLKID